MAVNTPGHQTQEEEYVINTHLQAQFPLLGVWNMVPQQNRLFPFQKARRPSARYTEEKVLRNPCCVSAVPTCRSASVTMDKGGERKKQHETTTIQYTLHLRQDFHHIKRRGYRPGKDACKASSQKVLLEGQATVHPLRVRVCAKVREEQRKTQTHTCIHV